MFSDNFWLKLGNVFCFSCPHGMGMEIHRKGRRKAYTVSGSPAGGRAAED